MNWPELVARWDLRGAIAISEAEGGLNNLTRHVVAGGERFILRVYQNTADRSRIAKEHDLLTMLQGEGLSFAVPAPVPTPAGERMVLTDDGFAASLCRWIPGRTAEAGNHADAAAAGAALGELTLALGRLDWQSRLPRYGDFATVHPAAEDPLAIPRMLGLAPEVGSAVADVIATAWAQVPGLYASLPAQPIHGDFTRGNILLEGGKASAVLDFEFAGHDLRILDLAVAFNSFAGIGWGDWDLWASLEAFGRGYGRHVHLTSEEVAALPQILRFSKIATVIHWTGRFVLGLASHENLVERAHTLLAYDGWVKANGERLVDRYWTWQAAE